MRWQSDRSKTDNRRSAPSVFVCEAVIATGLETIAYAELRSRFGKRVQLRQTLHSRQGTGALQFDYDGDLQALLRLRTVLSVFLLRSFAVPRPRALLGDEHFRALTAHIATARNLHPRDAYQTLYVNAAGSETAVMNRLKEALAQETGLAVALDDGDLVLRLRRSTDGTGWDVLVRLSPRPLATRPWRVCNMEGALNATVAQAMIRMTRPEPQDCFVNLACGSGTLLVERLACGLARRAIGCDTSAEALACAQANIAAAGYAGVVELHPWDAGTLPLPNGSVDALCADLPFGHLVGSHQANLELYPRILQEAARLARPGATFVLITHEVRLMEELLQQMYAWSTEEVRRIMLGGLHPRIFVLRRTARKE